MLSRRRFVKLTAVSGVSVAAACRDPSWDVILADRRLRKPVKAVASMRGDGFDVRVDAGGVLAIDTGRSQFAIHSFFSYPGDPIGWTGVSVAGQSGSGQSARRIDPQGEDRLLVAAQSSIPILGPYPARPNLHHSDALGRSRPSGVTLLPAGVG